MVASVCPKLIPNSSGGEHLAGTGVTKIAAERTDALTRSGVATLQALDGRVS